MKPFGLPVDGVLENVKTGLAENPCVILEALPGAGKTTCIPLALQYEPWLEGKKTIVLAPRRLAARAAAMRMSHLLKETVGQTVGYRVRMDSRVSLKTRIEVVTEGVLTRMLQSDPSLRGIGLVIFDEFHERSLDADLGLALCLDMQGVLNPDLRLLIMSATMEKGPLAAMMNHAPAITCPGRLFPVETRYLGHYTPSWSEDAIYRTVLSAAHDETGSILVFLPGAGEIQKITRRLNAARLGRECVIAPLFGNLTRREQDQAILPPPSGKRKIVLATSIAETSLTIEGIQVVIDSGLQRTPRFDPRSGLTRLVTVPVSRASADQRRGRAGRTGPGICLRLWSHQMHMALPAANRPEILEADLAGLVLEMACWGVDNPEALHWLDPPPKRSFHGSRDLLLELGALDEHGRATAHGKRMSGLPLHPRLAHMIISSESIGKGKLACDVAALLGERDVVRFKPGRQNADMGLRVDIMRAARRNRPFAFLEENFEPLTVDQGAVRRAIRISEHLHRRLGRKSGNRDTDALGQLLAWAYPDRVAQLRPGSRGKFLLTNGRGASLDSASPLASEPFLVAAELDGERREARIFRAAPIRLGTLIKQFEAQIQLSESVTWDPDKKGVNALRNLKLGALTLRSEPLPDPDPEQVLHVLLSGIAQQGIQCLPWNKALRRWQARICFLRRLLEDGETWPDISDEGLEENLARWLGPYLHNMDRLSDLVKVDLKGVLFPMLSYEQHRALDALAPTHLKVPSGSRIPIDYGAPVPVLAVRLQEMFGLSQSPSIAGGRRPLLIHLLSPAGRPVQITQDLAGFWKTGYHQVKKELKGRYPKHYWPDNPLQAQATARAKPKKKAHSRKSC